MNIFCEGDYRRRSGAFCSRVLQVMCLWVLVSGVSLGQGPDSGGVASGSASAPGRAVWVEAGQAELQSPQSCAALMATLRKMNVNEIYVEVFSLGESVYPSKLAPRMALLSDPDHDPLEVLTREARRDGEPRIRVVAVLDILRIYHYDGPSQPAKNHVVSLHADWLMSKNQGGTRDRNLYAYLDPGVEAARVYAESVVRELASGYAVDGVHLAGWQYPENAAEWGYNPEALREYQGAPVAEGDGPLPSDKKWQAWRRNLLTGLLSRIGQVAHEVRPSLDFSVSVSAHGPVPNKLSLADYERVFQDWPLWCQRGLVDGIVMENYRSQKEDEDAFLDWIAHVVPRKGDARLVVAVSGRENASSDVTMQMRLALGCGMENILLYSYQTPANDVTPESDLLVFLGETIFSPDYVVPEFMQRKLAFEPLRPQEKIDYSVDNVPTDFSAPPDLPPPVALATSQEVVARSVPMVRESLPIYKRETGKVGIDSGRDYSHSDAVLALLGKPFNPPPKRTTPREAVTRVADFVEQESKKQRAKKLEQAVAKSILYEVKLKSGVQFTAEILSQTESFILLRPKVRSGSITTRISKATVASMEPLKKK